MSSFAFIESPWAFAPIATEYAISSTIYITLLLKFTTKGNFQLMLASSASKLLAVSAVFTSNLNFFGLANIPFLLFQMLNEVTLLIWIIQGRNELNTTIISQVYRKRFKVFRIIGELLTIIVIFGLGMISPFLECPCLIETVSIFDTDYPYCQETQIARNIALVFTPQIRGLSFVIAILAGIVSINGLQFMLAGFLNRIKSIQRDNLESMGGDAPWKRKVREIYTMLAVLVAALFLVSFLVPGFRQCTPSTENVEDPEPRYSLGALSSSLFNAVLAISQMFTSDLMFRVSPNAKAMLPPVAEPKDIVSEEDSQSA